MTHVMNNFILLTSIHMEQYPTPPHAHIHRHVCILTLFIRVIAIQLYRLREVKYNQFGLRLVCSVSRGEKEKKEPEL